MKARILAFLGALVGTSCSGRATTPTLPEALDHDRLIILDAEDLAEQGIARGYDAVLPTLRQYVSIPATVEEIDDPDSGVATGLARAHRHRDHRDPRAPRLSETCVGWIWSGTIAFSA